MERKRWSDQHSQHQFKSVWNKICRYLWVYAGHQLGRPELLVRFIREEKLKPLLVVPPPDTLWTRSVVYWHEWMYCDLAYHARKYHLDYRTPGAEKRRLEMESIYMPDVEHMIQEELIPVHELDITEIGGISASKSQQHDIVDIDEFPLFRCKDYLEPITAAHLKENMDHGEIRLDDMHFKDFTWTQRRIYWINAGGSHHLASARHQAIRLNIPVTLQGKMTRLRVDSECIRRLRSRWDMYLVPKDEVFGAFFKAMNAFMCPFGHSELPRNFHNPSDPNDGLRVIWLLKESPKASAVARVLKDNGFPDFGTELELLSRYDPL